VAPARPHIDHREDETFSGSPWRIRVTVGGETSLVRKGASPVIRYLPRPRPTSFDRILQGLGTNTILPSMKCFLTVLLLSVCRLAVAETSVLAADESILIPKVTFDAKGDLVITASPASSPKDFDFLAGKWKMHNRHLNKRLENCKDWTEFDSSDENTKILGGNADMDTYSTTQFPGHDGKLFEGLTLRLFNPKTRLWSLYWIASNTGVIDPPVVGSFDNGVGHFFGKDTFKGKPIIVVFRWDARNKDRPVWGQAFSADKGKTWEWNFFNVSERP
jgi:hypothetical protein